MKKILKIIFNALPIALMIWLIPHIKDDYILTFAYLAIIGAALYWKHERMDFPILFFGFVIMILSEYFFIKTGVETFKRQSLLGIMPLWLPFLWAYGFVAIKRSTEIISKW